MMIITVWCRTRGTQICYAGKSKNFYKKSFRDKMAPNIDHTTRKLTSKIWPHDKNPVSRYPLSIIVSATSRKHFPSVLNKVTSVSLRAKSFSHYGYANWVESKTIGQNAETSSLPWEHLLCRRLQSTLINVILQLRAKVLHFHISSGLLLVTVVRQEGQIPGYFEVTKASETKRQIIDFNRSCLKLFIIANWKMLPPSLEPAFLNGTRNGVVQNQCNKATHCHACFQEDRHYLVNFRNTY